RRALHPPAAPQTATPERVAKVGPAAISGPRPGIAKAPIPASQPSAPPRIAPAPAPVVAPSGALVAFSCPRSRVPPRSGARIEISLDEKPAFRSRLAIRTA